MPKQVLDTLPATCGRCGEDGTIERTMGLADGNDLASLTVVDEQCRVCGCAYSRKAANV